jgi:hypothetical protein
LNFIVALREERSGAEEARGGEKYTHGIFQNLSVAKKHHEPHIHMVLLMTVK